MNSRRSFLSTSAALAGGLILTRVASNAQENAMRSMPGAAKPAKMDGGVANCTNDFWEVVANRRSVRKFKPDAIPEADIRRILDAGRLAPTSGNQQPWKFLVIQNPDTISRLRKATEKHILDGFIKRGDKSTTREEFEASLPFRMAGYFSAPAYIVVLTDNNSQYPSYNHWDGPMAAAYLMLAARSLGYGTVFITDAIPDSVTKDVLHIPDTYTRVCITPLGIPVEWPERPAKKKLEDFIAIESL